MSAGDDVWGAGAAAQRGAAAAGPGFVNELERYSGQYGGALDDELGSWWQVGGWVGGCFLGFLVWL